MWQCAAHIARWEGATPTDSLQRRLQWALTRMAAPVRQAVAHLARVGRQVWNALRERRGLGADARGLGLVGLRGPASLKLLPYPDFVGADHPHLRGGSPGLVHDACHDELGLLDLHRGVLRLQVRKVGQHGAQPELQGPLGVQLQGLRRDCLRERGHDAEHQNRQGHALRGTARRRSQEQVEQETKGSANNDTTTTRRTTCGML